MLGCEVDSSGSGQGLAEGHNLRNGTALHKPSHIYGRANHRSHELTRDSSSI
jgi:hypothetical protein